MKSYENFAQIEQSTGVVFEQLNAEVLKIRYCVALIPSEYASYPRCLDDHVLMKNGDTMPTSDSLLAMTTGVW